MGVITSADEARDNLKDRLINISKELKSAQEEAEKIIDPDTWGGDQWNTKFRGTMVETITEISNMRMMIYKMMEKL